MEACMRPGYTHSLPAGLEMHFHLGSQAFFLPSTEPWSYTHAFDGVVLTRIPI